MPTFGGQVGAPSMRANARGAERQKAAPTAQIGARLDAPNGAAQPHPPMATAQARNTPSLRLNPRILKALRLRRGLKNKNIPVRNLRQGI